MAQDELLRKPTADKITMLIFSRQRQEAARTTVLTADEIRQLRERANMSQAVFASLLNITTGYLSQLERGAKRPSGPALAMLHIIRRKGVDAIL